MTFLGTKPTGGDNISSESSANSTSGNSSESATSETEIDDLPF